MSRRQTTAPEWDFRIDSSEISSAPQSYFLSASDEECIDLSRRLGVERINELNAKLDISRDTGGIRIHVDGQLKARVVQNCVVTGDPIEAWIEEDFEAWFADKDQALSFSKARKDRQSKKGHVEIEVSDEAEDPEPVVDGFIEAGELVTQYLSLAINPYPRKEGVEADNSEEASGNVREPSSARKSPFEALKNWKTKR